MSRQSARRVLGDRERNGGSYRGLRGRSLRSYDYDPHATCRSVIGTPTYENHNVWFRVSAVPEPATIVMLAFGTLLMLRRRRGRE
jgi:hypothetical protein